MSYYVPEFYMPHPWRLSPHLEGARQHSKRWAREVGLLVDTDAAARGEGWDNAKFDAVDCALLCAYGHPDAPPTRLDLITDWYVWLFFFDDDFLRFKKDARQEGAREHVERLIACMVQPGSESPDSLGQTPLERALIDLWNKTMGLASIDWLTRFRTTTEKALREPLWELANIRRDRVANPIEYVGSRRRVGGALWTADLIELSMGISLSPSVIDTRQYRVLRDAYADAVHLHNDILSYEREIYDEGEHSNGVLVIERFLACDTARAVELVNDTTTSRVRLLEQVATVEVPLVCDSLALPLEDRLAFISYAKGLMDWLAGDYEWHQQSDRYPNSGPSATRIPGSRTFGVGRVGTTAAQVPALLACRVRESVRDGERELLRTHAQGLVEASGGTPYPRPDVYMPFVAHANPHREQVRQHCREWAEEMGMLRSWSLPTGQSPVRVWSASNFDAQDLAGFGSDTHPDCSRDELELISDWHVWGWYVDDVLATAYKRGRPLTAQDLASAQAFVTRLLQFLPDDLAHMPSTTNPCEAGLASIWTRYAPVLSPAIRRRFSAQIHKHLDANLWEILNLAQRRSPDLVDYVEMRRELVGSSFTIYLQLLARGAEVSDKLWEHHAVASTCAILGDWQAITNDLLSFYKEVAVEREPNNSVLLIHTQVGGCLEVAARIVNDLATARMQELELLLEQELASAFAEYDAESECEPFAKAVRDYLSGCLRWQQRSGRYPAQRETSPSGPTHAADPEGHDGATQAVLRTPFMPTGLGTAAIRLVSHTAPSHAPRATPPNVAWEPTPPPKTIR